MHLTLTSTKILFFLFLLLLITKAIWWQPRVLFREGEACCQWLNGTEIPQFTPACSQTADSIATIFVLSELVEIYKHVYIKSSKSESPSQSVALRALAASQLARIYSR